MSDIFIKELMTNIEMYNVIKVLREGPLNERTIIKILHPSYKMNKKKLQKILTMFKDIKLINNFELNNEDHYHLIKDFYLIRVPPKQLIEYVQKKRNIPLSLRERILTSIKQYFSSYVQSRSKLIADFENNLIEIIRFPNLMKIIDFIKKKPAEMKNLLNKYSIFKDIKKILMKFDIIDVYVEKSEEKNSWVFLKTDLQFDFFFPEYLIKKVTEDLHNKKIKKDLALRTLYSLKNCFLMNEKPEIFEELNNKIGKKIDLVTSLETEGEIPINEAIELKELYKEIGDFENKTIWNKKIIKWQKSI